MIYDFIYPILAFFLAVTGSLILWKYYGSRIVLNYATEAFFQGLEKAIADTEEDPKKMSREKKALMNLMSFAIDVAIYKIPYLITAEVNTKGGGKKTIFKLHPSLKLLAQGGRHYLMQVMQAQINQFMGGTKKGLNKVMDNVGSNNIMSMAKMFGISDKQLEEFAPYIQMFQGFQPKPGGSPAPSKSSVKR